MTISPENLEAIKRFEAEGGLFTMASGRFPSTFRSIKGLVLNTYAIVLNGNMIYDLDNDKIIWSNLIPYETVESLIYFTENKYSENKIKLWIYSPDKIIEFSLEKGESSADVIERIKSETSNAPILKIIVVQEPEISLELVENYQREFPELMLTQSWNQGLEINTITGGKGNAVKKLRELLGGKDVIHTVVTVGDYGNDIPMIEYADIGYAVANATDEVKAAADRITVHNREPVIAHIMEDLLNQ